MWQHLKSWTVSQRTPLLVGLLSRLAILVVALVAVRFADPVHPSGFLLHGGKPSSVPALDLFERWDAYWFLNIAREGYQYHGVQDQIGEVILHKRETNITPFPLYPASIWLLGHLTGDLTFAALLVSLLCYLIALHLLYQLVRASDDRSVATRTILYLSIYPTAFIFNAPYSESLYLLLALLCLREAAAGRWLTAGAAGLGVAATRLAGSLLAPCAMVAIWRRQQPLQAVLCGGMVLLGMAGFFLYLYWLTGDPLAYFTAQRGWEKGLVGPWTALGRLIASPLETMNLVYLGTVALFVPLVVAAWRERGAVQDDRHASGGSPPRALPPEQALFLGLGTLMPLCSSNPLGLPRYCMVLFPAFILLGRYGRQLSVHLTIVVLFCLVHGWVMLQWLTWRHSL